MLGFLSAGGMGRGQRGFAGPWIPPTTPHPRPRLEPTSPLPSTGSARPAPGAVAPGPNPPLHSPGSWEGMGREVPGVQQPHLRPPPRSQQPTLPRAGSRDPPAEDDEEPEQQQGLLQVPRVQLLGQDMQRIQGQQRYLGTRLLRPAGRGSLGHHGPRLPAPVTALQVDPGSPAWLQRGQ